MLMKANPASNMFDALEFEFAFDEHVAVEVKVYPDEQLVQFVEETQIEQPAEQAVQFANDVTVAAHDTHHVAVPV